jgi:tetratricopeptide (TPR) repeat protein
MRHTVRCRLPIIVVVLIAAWGCGTKPEPTAGVPGPVETAEFYLSNFYRSRMAKDLYQCLSPAARAALPYEEFVLLRQREVAVPELQDESAVARVEAAALKVYRVNDRHQVLYVLQQVRYPYTAGRYNHYRLVRLHVVNEHNRWYVEPFVDERTFTVRFLPALKRDALRKLYDQREEIADLIAADVQALRGGESAVVEEVATDTGSLVIPDLTEQVKPIPDETGQDVQETLRARLEVGKLHFRTGRLDEAEASFKSALDLDPLNATAQTYLDRIRQMREIQQEKQEMIKLIERMLQVEKQSGEN